MTLKAGREMDRRCVMNWLIEVYRDPTVAFNAYSVEQLREFAHDAFALLKEQETVKSKTISEELKQKMWNALYSEEDKFNTKYVGTKEHDNWFLIYRPWLQDGFNLAIKAIADLEGR